MIKITTIQNIVHPLWFLRSNLLETDFLLNQLKEYIQFQENNSENLFILDMNSIEDYFHKYEEKWSKERLNNAKNKIKTIHNQYAEKLERNLILNCNNLFIGLPIQISTKPNLTSKFISFINMNKINLDTHLKIIGHGAIRNACVYYSSKYLSRAINEKYNLKTTYLVNDPTSLD